MSKFEVDVMGPYPCWITINAGHAGEIRITHNDLLALESAVAEAKRQALRRLPRRDWHEIDPKLACAAPEEFK